MSCSAVSSFDSFRSSCPPLNLGSLHFDAPYVSLGFRLVRVVCSAESCSSPCRVLVTPTTYNSGPLALRGPSGVAATIRVDARLGNCRTRASSTPPVAGVRCQTPTADRQSAASCVRHTLPSKMLIVVFIFLLNNSKTQIYLNERRPIAYTVHRCALRGFHGITVTSYRPPPSVSKDLMNDWPACTQLYS